MGKINVLDKHTAELIAAGEVVERPASIVKEMMENSIDAGADSVTVEIKNGGISLIRVTDNGSGIMREDVRNAFKSHATSKIRKGDDLDSIATLGFRGEALASVAAVARVEMLTRRPEDDEGSHYKIEGGEEILLEESGCPAGTTMIVRDLFYNTPARMKFLKKDVAEANAVAVVVDKIALSHPEVTVRFIRDGELRLLTPGNGDLRSVIYEVFEKDFAANLIKVEYQYKELGVRGYISKPTSARSSRSLQSFFINGRYVRPRTCSAAIEEAYKGMIMTGKFPGCVLFLTMPPNTVDVNVHPAKLEVRFHSEKDVFDLVYYGVKQALRSGDSSPLAEVKNVRTQTNPYSMKADAPAERQTLFETQSEKRNVVTTSAQPHQWQKVTQQEIDKFKAIVEVAEEKKAQKKAMEEKLLSFKDHIAEIKNSHSSGSTYNIGETAKAKAEKQDPKKAASICFENEVKTYHPKSNILEIFEKPTPVAVEEPAQTADIPVVEVAEEKTGKIIGELFETYILIEYGDELLLVDKHAAHERYIYEKLKQRSTGKDSQLLLMPETVSLSREEHLALISALDDIAGTGFNIDDFGGSSVIVRAVPLWMEKADIAEIIGWMATAILKGQNACLPDFLDELYHSIACRAAVKAHDKSSPEELKYITELVAREDIRYCPHGRPVVCSVTRRQIEKMFKRLL